MTYDAPTTAAIISAVMIFVVVPIALVLINWSVDKALDRDMQRHGYPRRVDLVDLEAERAAAEAGYVHVSDYVDDATNVHGLREVDHDRAA